MYGQKFCALSLLFCRSLPEPLFVGQSRMVGASALDGPDMAVGIAIMTAGLAALRIGDLLIKIQRKEVMWRETAEKACAQRKEDTFRNWIKTGELGGVQVRQ